MKNFFKKLAACAVMGFSLFMFTACGEVKVTLYYGEGNKEIKVAKDDAQTIIDEINALAEQGYEVKDIYFDKEYSNKWNQKDEIGRNSNLYIEWQGISYPVKFEANLATGGQMQDQAVRYGETAAALTTSTYTRTGYSFAGWATSEERANAGTVDYLDGATFTMTSIGGVTLYAVWAANDYNVVFDGNGANAGQTMASQVITYDSTKPLTSNSFTKTGYSFTGWNTKADGSGISYPDSCSYTMVNEGVTLYAQWSANTYKVKFNGNGANGSMQELSVVFDQSVTLTSNIFTKAGHFFAGWNTKADGSGVSYEDGATLEMNVVDGVTLYAQWTREVYNLTLKDDSITLFTLNGISYGSTIAEHANFDESELNQLIEEKREQGFAFGGFFVNGNFNGQRFNLNSEISDLGNNNANVTLVVRWATLEDSITLNYDGATSGNEAATLPVTFDSAIGTLPTPAKDGYTFIGWYTSTSSFTTATLVTPATIWEDNFSQIHAKFVSNSQAFTISYDNDGGDFASTSVLDYYTNVDTVLVNPVKNGYIFVSFTLAETAIINGVETPAGTILPKNNNEEYYLPAKTFGNVSLKANYHVRINNITFDYAGGECSGSEVSTFTILVDKELADATKPGYNFAGYKLAAAAVIGGESREAGYALPKNSGNKYYIPAGSYGDISLIATYEVATYTVTYDLKSNGSFTAAKPAESYNILSNAITIPTVSRPGYDFVKLVVKEACVLGGTAYEAGAELPKEAEAGADGVLNYIIPTGSYGNITVVAEYQIQTHTVTFKGEDDETILTLTGDYNSDISTLDGYDEALIITGMAKSGFAFGGWYTSKENINDNTKFDNKINYLDITLYPYYVEQLAAPTNVAIGQESSIITWDAVDGADYYLVKIDGGEAQVAHNNQFETGLILSAADTYVIEVQAVSTYVGVLGENINSDFTQIEFTRNTTLQNSLISVRDQDETLIKYVMFTDNVYNWTSANYSVEIKNLSNDEMATVSQSTEDDERVKSTISTVKPGTFTLVVNYNDAGREDDEFNVLVVENVSSLSYGEAYSQYLTNTDPEKTKYLDKENVAPYYAGTLNSFAVDFTLSDPNGNVFTDYDLANEELITYSYKVYDEASETFVAATSSEIPYRITKEDVAAGKATVNSQEVTLNQFDKAGNLIFSSANAGKKYKITVTLTYSRNITSTNAFGTVSTDFVVTLNEAMNAHSHEELKLYYADKDVHEINVLRNITLVGLTSDKAEDIPAGAATLSVDQVQPDGSPIATTSWYVYDSDSTTSNGGSAVYKTDGNVYKRAFGLDDEGYNGVGDNIKVNGNYCTIDASGLTPVSLEYSKDDSSGPNTNAYNQVGYMWAKHTNYKLIRPHVGIFRYQVVHGEGAVFNNLEIVGNKPTGRISSDDENFSERITRESASYTGFYSETSKLTLNNVIMSKLHNGVRMDGDFKEWGMQGSTFVVTNPNNGEIETNYTKISDVYGHALYSWEGKEIRAYNSHFSYCGGPAILISNEGTPTDPILIVDKHTVIDNFLTGTEAWFVVYNQTSLAQQLKVALQGAMANMGASVLKVIDGIQYTNFTLAYQPCSVTDNSKYLETGEYVETTEIPRRSKCTVYLGGEKTVIDGKNRSTGVVTERGTVDYLSSGDPRAASGMHAFGVTPAVSTTEFQLASLAAQHILTNVNLRPSVILYAHAKEIATVTYNSNKETYDSQGVTVEDITARLKATHFANAMSILQTATGIPTFTMNELAFEALCVNFAEYAVLRSNMNDLMKVYTDDGGDYIMQGGNKVTDPATIQAVITGYRSALLDGIANMFASEQSPKAAVLASIELKYTYEMFYELCKLNGQDKLLTVQKVQSTYGDVGTVQFMLLKMCDAANLDDQLVEIQVPTAEIGMMSIFIDFGFQDEEEWLTPDADADGIPDYSDTAE